MRTIVTAVVGCLMALPVLAAESTGGAADNPMANWRPPKVTREGQDKKEIAALWKAMQAAEKKGDVNAAADLVDYPVLMMTDDSKGDGMGESWTREKWIQVMEPFYKHPNPDMNATHKTSVFLMSDSLASVDDVCTMKMGGKTTTVRNSTLVIKKGGKWLVKAMAEGGWGDMVAAGSASAGQGSPGTTSGQSDGTAQGGSQTGTGSSSGGSGPSGAQGTGSSESSPPRTTK